MYTLGLSRVIHRDDGLALYGFETGPNRILLLAGDVPGRGYDRAVQLIDDDERAVPPVHTIEFVDGPRAGEREADDGTRDVIAAPGGRYARSMRCADDGALRYIWRPELRMSRPLLKSGGGPDSFTQPRHRIWRASPPLHDG